MPRHGTLALTLLLSAAFHDQAPAQPPARLPRFEPLTTEQALKAFRAQQGFRVDLLAAEPLVMDPVAAAYDEDGRLYVVEMSDYPHVEEKNDRAFQENLGDPPIGRVRVLIDRDDDGVFDASHILADRLSWPTGIAAYKGGVFVAATPDLWYLKDTDGDFKADVRKKVFSGFRKFNVQAVINNLRWGVDHKIYGAGSSNGGKIREGDDPKSVDLLRRDFRFDPEGLRFEPISGGARFGNTFDAWGNRFLCDIRNPAQQVVLPANYLARNPFLPAPRALYDSAEGGDGIPLFRVSPPEPWRELRARRWASVGKAMPRSELVGAGFLTSSSGITAYRGDAYPESFRGNLFLGEVANHLIHRMAVTPEGVTFRARRADAGVEFITSTDTWFRPVNFVNAPDGTLHLLDMYRETIEHPWSIPDDIRALLDLRSGEDKGRVYRITPPGFARRETPKLSKASTAGLVALLEHPNGWHSETAHRLLFERRDKAAVPALAKLLRKSPHAHARYLALFALEGLGSLTDDDLLTALVDRSEHVRESAIRLAEPRLARSELVRLVVLTLSNDPGVRVRFQAAFTLGEIHGEESAKALANIASRDAGDPWVRTAVLSSAGTEPAALFARLLRVEGFSTGADGQGLLKSLALMIGAKGDAPTVRAVLDALASTPADDNALVLLTGLGDGLSRSRVRLEGVRKGLNAESSAWLDRVHGHARTLALDEKAVDARRSLAIGVLGRDLPALAFEILPPLLKSSPPLQAAAVRALCGLDRPEVAGIVLGGWKGFSPALRNEAIGLLLARRGWIPAVLAAVKSGTVPAAQIPPARRALLLADRDPMLRAEAAALLGESPAPRREALAKYRPAIENPGKPERGRLVYERECASCHQLGQKGHAVGPNLAGVRRRTAEEILTNILDPNREVSPEFLEHSLALDDGRVVTGLVASETPAAITLKGREAAEQTILRRNVSELNSTGKSLMPEGLEKTIKPDEMADLIAYLLKIQVE